MRELQAIARLRCSVSGEIFGTPTAKLMKSLEGVDVRVYAPFQSL
ncbi:MAG TPA: hypothetical protein VLV86_12315 [Vicinamibacterales bacterium]|nr:hypothetical protein [Thermoanaerobaculia bacterium]HUK34694.1 hypothetical protein [Vicinamibacterales bacterium]